MSLGSSFLRLQVPLPGICPDPDGSMHLRLPLLGQLHILLQQRGLVSLLCRCQLGGMGVLLGSLCLCCCQGCSLCQPALK